MYANTRWSHINCWKPHWTHPPLSGLTMHLSRWVWMTSGSTSFTFRTWSSAFTPSRTCLQSSIRCSKLAGFWKSWNFVDTSRSFLYLEKKEKISNSEHNNTLIADGISKTLLKSCKIKHQWKHSLKELSEVIWSPECHELLDTRCVPVFKVPTKRLSWLC